MALFYLKGLVLKISPPEVVPVSPTGQFKQNLDSFYVADRALSVTIIAQIVMFYLY